MIRIIDYYDLIELPDGSHIPVPMAIKMVGLKKVLEIPVAKTKRTSYFYWCEECHQDALYWGELYEGSFFKCRLHNRNYYDPIRQKVKEITFRRLVESPKLIELLKYIEVAESERWRSVGWLKVEYKWVVRQTWCGFDYIITEAYGRMREIAEIEYIRRELEDVRNFMEKIKKHKQSISKHYERIAESLDKFLPLRIWERFEWIIDDVKVKYGVGIDGDHLEDNSYPICLEVIPSYKLTPEEWYALHYQIVNFLYEVLPEEIANLVGVCLWMG